MRYSHWQEITFPCEILPNRTPLPGGRGSESVTEPRPQGSGVWIWKRYFITSTYSHWRPRRCPLAARGSRTLACRVGTRADAVFISRKGCREESRHGTQERV